MPKDIEYFLGIHCSSLERSGQRHRPLLIEYFVFLMVFWFPATSPVCSWQRSSLPFCRLFLHLIDLFLCYLLQRRFNSLRSLGREGGAYFLNSWSLFRKPCSMPRSQRSLPTVPSTTSDFSGLHHALKGFAISARVRA